jgi:RNA polymerase subunit RPABC4/transcription elongation factor Spt4/ribosomal protein L7/L12
MALIKCSECGKEVSEKASSCPNCGNPINHKPQTIAATQSSKQDDDDCLYCPKCHSKNLHTQHKGFSGGKAFAGAVLTGGIGLLAGTIGSKNVQITCLKCGNKFKAGEALKKSDIDRIERSKRQISRENTLALAADKDITELINSGNKVAASELYKERKGVSLEEANKYVNELERAIKGREKRKKEERFATGCGIVLVIVVVIFLIAIFS